MLFVSSCPVTKMLITVHHCVAVLTFCLGKYRLCTQNLKFYWILLLFVFTVALFDLHYCVVVFDNISFLLHSYRLCLFRWTIGKLKGFHQILFYNTIVFSYLRMYKIVYIFIKGLLITFVRPLFIIFIFVPVYGTVRVLKIMIYLHYAYCHVRACLEHFITGILPAWLT